MTKSQKILISLGVLIAIALVMLLILRPAKAGRSSYAEYSTSTATSSKNFMTIGTGTTTLSFLTQDAEQVDIFLRFNASSTATVLNWRYEYSYDNIEWYGEDIEATNTATSTIHASDFKVHTWQFATSTTDTLNIQSDAASVAKKHIQITNLNSPYMRMKFFVTNDRGAIWAKAITKTPDPF